MALASSIFFLPVLLLFVAKILTQHSPLLSLLLLLFLLPLLFPKIPVTRNHKKSPSISTVISPTSPRLFLLNLIQTRNYPIFFVFSVSLWFKMLSTILGISGTIMSTFIPGQYTTPEIPFKPSCRITNGNETSFYDYFALWRK